MTIDRSVKLLTMVIDIVRGFSYTCLREWRPELRSVPSFTILTDHKNLEYFRKKQRLTERQTRWMEFMSELPPFTTIYRPGRLSAAPDALSRREQDMPENADDPRLREREVRLWKEEWDLPEVAVPGIRSSPARVHFPLEEAYVFENETLQRLWKSAVTSGPEYRSIHVAIAESDTSRFPASLGLNAAAQMSEASLVDGIPYYRGSIWIPEYEPLRTAIIQRCHDTAESGHPGRDGTLEAVRRQFYWPGMSHDVRRFVRNCDVCGRTKIWREKKRGLLRPLPAPERPWAGISIDFMVGLPLSRGCQNLMVITDRLTGSLTLAPLQELSTKAVAEEFLRGSLPTSWPAFVDRQRQGHAMGQRVLETGLRAIRH